MLICSNQACFFPFCRSQGAIAVFSEVSRKWLVAFILCAGVVMDVLIIYIWMPYLSSQIVWESQIVYKTLASLADQTLNKGFSTWL